MRFFNVVCCFVPCVTTIADGSESDARSARVKQSLASKPGAHVAPGASPSPPVALSVSEGESITVQRQQTSKERTPHSRRPAPTFAMSAVDSAVPPGEQAAVAPTRQRSTAMKPQLGSEGAQPSGSSERQRADRLSVARQGLNQLVMDLRFPLEEQLRLASVVGPSAAGYPTADGISDRSLANVTSIAGRRTVSAVPSRSSAVSMHSSVQRPERPPRDLTGGTSQPQRQSTQHLRILQYARSCRTDNGSDGGPVTGAGSDAAARAGGQRQNLSGSGRYMDPPRGGASGRVLDGWRPGYAPDSSGADGWASSGVRQGDCSGRGKPSSPTTGRTATAAVPLEQCTHAAQPRVGPVGVPHGPAAMPAAAVAATLVANGGGAASADPSMSRSYPPLEMNEVARAVAKVKPAEGTRSASAWSELRKPPEGSTIVPCAASTTVTPPPDRGHDAPNDPYRATQIAAGHMPQTQIGFKGTTRTPRDAPPPSVAVPLDAGSGGSGTAAFATAAVPSLAGGGAGEAAAATTVVVPLTSLTAVNAGQHGSSNGDSVSVSFAGLGGACWAALESPNYDGPTDATSDLVLLQPPPVLSPPSSQGGTGAGTGTGTYPTICSSAPSPQPPPARSPLPQPDSDPVRRADQVPRADAAADESAYIIIRRSASVPVIIREQLDALLDQGQLCASSSNTSNTAAVRAVAGRSFLVRSLLPASRPVPAAALQQQPPGRRLALAILPAVRRCNHSTKPNQSNGGVNGAGGGGVLGPLSIWKSNARVGVGQHGGGGRTSKGRVGSVMLVNSSSASMGAAGEASGHLQPQKAAGSSGSSGRHNQPQPRQLQGVTTPSGPASTAAPGPSPYSRTSATAVEPTAAELHGLTGSTAGQRPPLYASRHVSQMALMPFLQLSNSNAFQPASSAPASFNLPALSREITGLRWIGQGGGGAVFQGVWQGVPVAVKFLLTEAGGRVDAAALEGVVSTVVNHPNVLHTYTFECTRLTEASFNEQDPLPVSIEEDGTELLESLLESCTTLSDSLSLARRARALQGTAGGTAGAAGAPGAGGLVSAAATTSTTTAGAAGTAQRPSRLGIPTLMDDAPTTPQQHQQTQYSGDWHCGGSDPTSASSPPPRPSLTACGRGNDVIGGGGRGGGSCSSNGTAAGVTDAILAGTRRLAASRVDAPAGYGSFDRPSGGRSRPIPFGPPSIVALGRPATPVHDRASASRHDGSAQLPHALHSFFQDMVSRPLVYPPPGSLARSSRSQPRGQHGGSGGSATPPEADVIIVLGSGRSGAGGSGGRSGPRATPAATSGAAGAAAAAAAGLSAALSPTQRPISGSVGNNLSGPWGATGKLNSTFHSDDGFGDPEACSGGQCWTVRHVLSYLKAKPGMYLTHIIMEYCGRGSLLSAIKRGIFREDSTWPEEGEGAEGSPGAFGPRDSTGAEVTLWTTSANVGRAVAGSRNAALATADTPAQTGAAARRVVFRALLRTARDVAQGMCHLHASGIIHGDLKPGNVLLRSCRTDRRGFVAVVGDFGLSKVTRGEKPLDLNHWSTVTVMAPEVIMGTWLKASDVFSFGILLWQLVTGEVMPYGTCTVPQILVGVSQGTLTPTWPSRAHPALVRLGKACLATNPEKRPKFEAIVKMLTKIEKNVRSQLRQEPERRKPSASASASPAGETGHGHRKRAGAPAAAGGYGGGGRAAAAPPPAGSGAAAHGVANAMRRGASVNDIRVLATEWSCSAGSAPFRDAIGTLTGSTGGGFAGGFGHGAGDGDVRGGDEGVTVSTLGGFGSAAAAASVGGGDGDSGVVDCTSTEGLCLGSGAAMSPQKLQYL